MKCIVGLGNPGSPYEQTRHNAGFLILDELARQLNTSFRPKRSVEADVAETQLDNQERILLVKPQTFMNVSGRSVASIFDKYPTDAKQLLVVYDDADLPYGDVRFKHHGSSAGHRGMESILNTLPKGVEVARVRFGIGRPLHPDIPLEDFVLTKWTADETKNLPKHIQTAIDSILAFIHETYE